MFITGGMGSLVYARKCRERGENIVCMISLETMGYYSDEEGSQDYPFPLSLFYPDVGNFIAIVGNTSSKEQVMSFAGKFMRESDFPVECAAPPGILRGVGWSDHSSFWRYGYSAIMVTDTALFRYPYYHTPEDTVDKIDYDALARVVTGLRESVLELVGEAT